MHPGQTSGRMLKPRQWVLATRVLDYSQQQIEGWTLVGAPTARIALCNYQVLPKSLKACLL